MAEQAPDRNALPRRDTVGVCSSCEGPVLYAPEHREAVCPCGATRIPAAFMRLGSE